jgi:hypothetical protein
MDHSSCCAPAALWMDVYGAPVRPRRHGLECPLDPFQIVAWATIAALVTVYGMMLAPMLPVDAEEGLSVVIAVMSVVTVTLKLILTLGRNEVDGIFPEGGSTTVRLDYHELLAEPPEGKDPCFYCRIFVPRGSKHCSVCDKCVPEFDHHCRWLNSCIGGKITGCLWRSYRPLCYLLLLC